MNDGKHQAARLASDHGRKMKAGDVVTTDPEARRSKNAHWVDPKRFAHMKAAKLFDWPKPSATPPTRPAAPAASKKND